MKAIFFFGISVWSLRSGYLYRMSKSVNGDYGSFSNTPINVTPGSVAIDQQSRGHQRNDSSIVSHF